MSGDFCLLAFLGSRDTIYYKQIQQSKGTSLSKNYDEREPRYKRLDRNREARFKLSQDPKKIEAMFHECYKKEYQEYCIRAMGPCWVWKKLTKKGTISLLAGQPRFGVGILAVGPAQSQYAKRYIYAIHYKITRKAWMPKNIRMQPFCHKLCVNPEHMASPASRL
jgi:hypothetical protein